MEELNTKKKAEAYELLRKVILEKHQGAENMRSNYPDMIRPQARFDSLEELKTSIELIERLLEI